MDKKIDETTKKHLENIDREAIRVHEKYKHEFFIKMNEMLKVNINRMKSLGIKPNTWAWICGQVELLLILESKYGFLVTIGNNDIITKIKVMAARFYIKWIKK